MISSPLVRRASVRPGLLKRTSTTDYLAFFFALGVSVLAVALTVESAGSPIMVAAPFAALALATLLWRVPTFSLYFLLFMALMVEYYPHGFADATTELLGLWNNLSTHGMKGVPVSPAELMMVGAAGSWLIRGLVTQTLVIRSSPLFRIYAWYYIAVVIGLVHGLATGGTFAIALWEIRAQVYGVIVFFLLINLFQSRRHVELFTWGVILGTGLKGVQGTWRYLVTLGGSFNGENIFDHDEAFFFPCFYIFVLLLWVFGGTTRQKKTGLMFIPFVLIAEIANRRRVSTAALLIAIIALIFILYVLLQERRLKLMALVSVGLVFVTLYAGAFWNSTSKIAQPVMAIKSSIAPNERDASSNEYRAQEDYNLMYAIRQNPILGRGYGIPMENVSRMWNLEEVDPFILYRPHNSILWVWWRVGIIGAVIFWMGMGLAIIRHCFIARTTMDPYLRRWAVFSVCAVVVYLLISWFDMGQFQYRTTVFVWMVMAIVEFLARSDKHVAALSGSPGAHT